MLINLKTEAALAMDNAVATASSLINKAIEALGGTPTDGDELLIELDDLGIPEHDLRKVVRLLSQGFPQMDVSIWKERASYMGEQFWVAKGIRVRLVKETLWESFRRFIQAW